MAPLLAPHTCLAPVIMLFTAAIKFAEMVFEIMTAFYKKTPAFHLGLPTS